MDRDVEMTTTAAAQDQQGQANALPADAPEDAEQELNRAIEELRGISSRAGVSASGRIDEVKPANASSSGAALQIPLEVNVILGSTELTLAELSVLKIGSTLKLDRIVGDPLDLVVNGIRIARGELVIADKQSNTFGFRISSVIS